VTKLDPANQSRRGKMLKTINRSRYFLFAAGLGLLCLSSSGFNLTQGMATRQAIPERRMTTKGKNLDPAIGSEDFRLQKNN
jgi:hypothetical protein